MAPAGWSRGAIMIEAHRFFAGVLSLPGKGTISPPNSLMGIEGGVMANRQQRGNREQKKPKKDKSKIARFPGLDLGNRRQSAHKRRRRKEITANSCTKTRRHEAGRQDVWRPYCVCGSILKHAGVVTTSNHETGKPPVRDFARPAPPLSRALLLGLPLHSRHPMPAPVRRDAAPNGRCFPPDSLAPIGRAPLPPAPARRARPWDGVRRVSASASVF